MFLQGTSSYEKGIHLTNSLLLDQIVKVFFTPHKIKKLSSLNKYIFQVKEDTFNDFLIAIFGFS